ncbi:MAG: dephospho-CoA kinase [Pseudomonadota bacterium]|nr:dephospho-CoA kinase [Pseudomonadota bacterium]
MLKVALTGGIGSGKTTVTNRFRELSVPVFDADEVSREITRTGEPAVNRIAKQFGDSVILSDGSLDRSALREIVFKNPGARRRLEAILHPEIRKRMNRAAARTSAPYGVFSIPLLIETGQQDSFDRVLVIEATQARRRQWIRDRSSLTHSQINAIFRSQASSQVRRQSADDLLMNNGSIIELYRQVDTLHSRYLMLAKALHS